MFSPLVSIVIPIFNRENTLHYCIDSVLLQDYENWELLLIDDGSVDHSSEICLSYSQKDRRIKYFYQKNQGAGPARNYGIEKSKGDWITFIDSDDAIMPNHLNQLQQFGEDCDLVMVNRCKAKYENGMMHIISKDTEKMESASIRGNKNIVEYLYGEGFDPYHHANFACWDKFFKMSVIKEHHVMYPVDVPTGQDQVFVVNYFKHCESFYFSNIGTYAPTPMGNEGIDHLACKLRLPQEFLYCQIKNYEALMELAIITESASVKRYAVNYILDKPFTRIIRPYTKWRNRIHYGKKELLDFIQKDFMPIIQEHKEELVFVNNTLYREQLYSILKGNAPKVYDYWFWKNFRHDATSAIRRRLK